MKTYNVKTRTNFRRSTSIRALIDLSDLITVMPIERAIQRTIIDKLEDENSKPSEMQSN